MSKHDTSKTHVAWVSPDQSEVMLQELSSLRTMHIPMHRVHEVIHTLSAAHALALCARGPDVFRTAHELEPEPTL